MEPAGLIVRFVAAFIDMVVLCVLFYALAFVLWLLVAGGGGLVGLAMTLSWLLGLVLGAAYYIALEVSSRQGTVGKLLLGLQVVDLDGHPLSLSEAIWRHLGRLVCVMTLGLGFAMAGWSRDGMALHDRISETMVVVKEEVFEEE